MNLKTERQKKGMTQSELARMLGVDIRTVGRWERGETEPIGSNLLKLQELFGTQPRPPQRMKIHKLADEVAALPRRRREAIERVIEAML